MKKNILEQDFYSDTASKGLLSLIENDKEHFNSCTVFYKYPIIKELDKDPRYPSVLLASPQYGIIIFKCDSTTKFRDLEDLTNLDEELSWIEDNIFSKIIKSSNKKLKKGKRMLTFNLSSVLFLPNFTDEDEIETDCRIITNKGNLLKYFDEIIEENEPVDEDLISDALAIIEGSIAIIKPKERELEENQTLTKAYLLNKLEEEIAKFDDAQKYAALSQIEGPQRIRGLAGSGKTIILCMKAALLHLKYPDKKILYTFMTKSLYDYIENLITRFYKTLGDGSLPDFNNCIHIRHAWGGENIKGVYYETCKRENSDPKSYIQAARRVGTKSSFDYVCQSLLEEKNGKLNEYYDYVLIDEAQDFGASFYKLCRAIVKNDCIVWGYDELQNIFEVKMQDTKALFEDKELGLEGINLVELQKNHPDMDNDIVLSKSYRNLKEILVLAHSIGLGIYNETLIQSLENNDHWNDLGYSIIEGECINDNKVIIERPDNNSPLAEGYNRDVEDIIKVYSAREYTDEVNFVCNQIEEAIRIDKLRADDIMVICLDDRYARRYFESISNKLYGMGIYTHNLTSNSYEKGFLEDKCVTLTTVYKAKGNEAAMVFVIGCDVFEDYKDNRQMRNKMFTAITRAKAWVRLSGINIESDSISKEIKSVKDKNFILEFIHKDENVIKRDLDKIYREKAVVREQISNLLIDLEEKGHSKDEIMKMIEGMVKGGK